MLLVAKLSLVLLLAHIALSRPLDACDSSDDECASNKPPLSCHALSVDTCLEAFSQSHPDFLDCDELASALFDHVDSPASILKYLISQSDVDVSQFADAILYVSKEHVASFKDISRAEQWIVQIIDLSKDGYYFDKSLGYYLLGGIHELQGNLNTAIEYYQLSSSARNSQYTIPSLVGICRTEAFHAIKADHIKRPLILDAKEECILILKNLVKNRQVSYLVSR